MKSLVLLSGGLDSAVCLALELHGGNGVVALAIDYGQQHKEELEAAHRVAVHYGVDLRRAKVSMPFGDGVALLGGATVPAKRTQEERQAGIAPTYVPGRNTVLLALALGLAEVVGAKRIVIGATMADQAGYPDCRPGYMAAFGALAASAAVSVSVCAPLISMDKVEIGNLARELRVPVSMTRSCYLPGTPCGVCDACVERERAVGRA